MTGLMEIWTTKKAGAGMGLKGGRGTGKVMDSFWEIIVSIFTLNGRATNCDCAYIFCRVRDVKNLEGHWNLLFKDIYKKGIINISNQYSTMDTTSNRKLYKEQWKNNDRSKGLCIARRVFVKEHTRVCLRYPKRTEDTRNHT